MAKRKQDSTEQQRSMEPEVFLSAHRRIRDWKIKIDETKAGGQAAVKSAKNLGVDMVAYKFVQKLANMDRADAATVLRNVIVQAEMLDLGLGNQQELFNLNSDLAGLTEKVTREHKEWEAEKAGYEAGKSGDLLDNNPHDPGTNMHERWVVGWHDGYQTRKVQEAEGIIKPRKSSNGNPEDGEGEDG